MKPYYEDLATIDWKSVPSHIRHRLRKKGYDIPKFSAGVSKGYKQSKEHVAKRCRYSENHHNFKGEKATVKTGRTRAERLFPKESMCFDCGNSFKRLDRHHIDGNTLNNSKENIVFLCRRCHMQRDGRLANFIKIAKENQPHAVAARWN